MNQTIQHPHSLSTHFGISLIIALLLHSLIVIGFYRFEQKDSSTKKQFVGSLTGVTLNSSEAIDVKGIHGDGTGAEVGNTGIIESYGTTILKRAAPGIVQEIQRGEVIIQVKVTPEGFSQEQKIIKSSGSNILDEEALKMARAWKFHQRRKSADLVTVEKKIIFESKP